MFLRVPGSPQATIVNATGEKILACVWYVGIVSASGEPNRKLYRIIGKSFNTRGMSAL